MGSYNSQYESYYNGMVNKRRTYNGYSYGQGIKNNDFLSPGYLMRRLVRDLIGVLILFVFVISCKLIVTPKTKQIYNYSKSVINESYDYKKTLKYIEGLKFDDVVNQSKDLLNKVKEKVDSGLDVDGKIKEQGDSSITGAVIHSFFAG